MRYYPIFVDLRDRPCRVFGAGELAAQKAAGLRQAGAQLTIVGARPCASVRALAEEPGVVLIERPFRPGDLDGVWLAIDASEDEQLHQRIAAEARRVGTWLNVVDRPSACDFIAPAVVQRGELTIAVSTSGASPALAKRIREDLERVYGDEYGQALELLRAVRVRLTAMGAPLELRQQIFKKLAASALCRYLRDGRLADVDRLLADIVGPEISLAALDLDWNMSEDE